MGPFDTKCITGIPLLKQAKPYQSNHLDHLVLILCLLINSQFYKCMKCNIFPQMMNATYLVTKT